MDVIARASAASAPADERFDVALGAVAAGPRLLLVSYHFPPAGSAGSLRWQKLAGLAAERGWGLDVVTAHPDAASVVDAARLNDLPAGTRIRYVAEHDTTLQRFDRLKSRLVKALRARRTAPQVSPARGDAARPALPPQSMAADQIRFRPLEPRSWLRAYNCLVSAGAARRWATDAARAASAIAEPGVHLALVTCGPPHMVHDTARPVTRRLGIPQVMDMRDPWAERRRVTEEFASPIAFLLAERHERRSVRDAALVVVNTPAVAETLGRRYPGARVVTVMNGFDEEPLPNVAAGDRFVVRYAGAIYLDRDPAPLFRAARRVIDRLALEPSAFGIELMGSVHAYGGRALADIARDEAVVDYLTLLPPRPRAEALRFMAGASVLVSLPQDSPWAIPSKIFEYLRFPAWLLALTEQGSAIDLALRGSDADVVDPADVDAIARVLERRCVAFREGARPSPLAASLSAFSRRRQADVLFDEIERLTGVAAGHGAAFDLAAAGVGA